MCSFRLALGLFSLFLFCCHIGTQRSSHSNLKTPGQFSGRNIRKVINIDSKQPRRQASALALLSLLLAGDVHLNPGPRGKTYYPCGLCDRDVECCDCIQCDDCDIWYHKSCIELSTPVFEALQKSSAVWICPKCDSLNCSSFTFRSYSLDSENYYSPLHCLDGSIPSLNQSRRFSPLKTSSPHGAYPHPTSPTASKRRSATASTDSRNTGPHEEDLRSSPPPPQDPPSSHSASTSSIFDLPRKQNLRIMTVNCRSIVGKKAEFAAVVNYTKPDVICGTESWLEPDVQQSEVFPDGYISYRKDRSTLAGGVFILVHKSLVSSLQPELDADCELIWTRIHLKRNKDLTVGCFYMAHRNQHDLDELDASLNKITAGDRQEHVLLVGDFNCPNVNWGSGAVEAGAPERPVQQYLVDITSANFLTQIHDEPTREDNILDLVFTSNPSLCKSSRSIPGISDHSIVITDVDIHPHRIKEKPRKQLIYSKARWDNITTELDQLAEEINTMKEKGETVEAMWTRFKSSLMAAVERFIPSTLRRSNYSLPWINRKMKKILQRKKRLYNQAKKTGNWSNYRFAQKECRRQMRQAEWNHINQTIEDSLKENNTKPFWRYVKSRRQDNAGVSPLYKGGSLHSDSTSKAKILLQQFQSVFTKRDDSPPPELKGAPVHRLRSLPSPPRALQNS